MQYASNDIKRSVPQLSSIPPYLVAVSPPADLLHVDDEVEVGPLVRVVPGLVEGGDEDAAVLAALGLEGLHGGGDHAGELAVRPPGLSVEKGDLRMWGRREKND